MRYYLTYGPEERVDEYDFFAGVIGDCSYEIANTSCKTSMMFRDSTGAAIEARNLEMWHRRQKVTRRPPGYLFRRGFHVPESHSRRTKDTLLWTSSDHIYVNLEKLLSSQVPQLRARNMSSNYLQ